MNRIKLFGKFYVKGNGYNIMTWNPNPVRHENGAWWFYDETWAFRDGPYLTEEKATEECSKYCERELIE